MVIYPAEILGGDSIGNVPLDIILGDSITPVNSSSAAFERELVVDAVLCDLFRQWTAKLNIFWT